MMDCWYDESERCQHHQLGGMVAGGLCADGILDLAKSQGLAWRLMKKVYEVMPKPEMRESELLRDLDEGDRFHIDKKLDEVFEVAHTDQGWIDAVHTSLDGVVTVKSFHPDNVTTRVVVDVKASDVEPYTCPPSASATRLETNRRSSK